MVDDRPNPHAFPIEEFGEVVYLYEGDRTSMLATAARWLDFTDPDPEVELWIRVRPREHSISVELEYLEVQQGLLRDGEPASGTYVDALDEAFASLSTSLNDRLLRDDPE